MGTTFLKRLQAAGIKTEKLHGYISLLICGFLILVMIFLLIVPKARNLSKTKQGLLQLQQNLQGSFRGIEMFSQKKIQDLVRNQAKTGRSIPEREAFYDYLQEVREIGVSLGITQINYYKETPKEISSEEILSDSEFRELPGMEDAEGLVLRGVPVRLQFHASYRVLYAFINALQQTRRYAVIHGLEVKKLPEVLDVELKAEIYFLRPSLETEDAA